MREVESNFMVPWSFDTNWTIVNGSLGSSVTVESTEYPITESDTDDSARRSPLVLKPSRLDPGPCEIKICFRKKYDICQIYVRSTARVYEVYYSHSPQSSNEYLCTVRCSAAERDEKLLQTTGIEYVSQENGDCFVGELPEDIVTDGGSGDDDWVNIKVPEVGRSSSDKTNTNRVKSVQDLYEATAQISNAEPCSFLTIRFLSLQNKSIVYVDEVYVFADLAESTDSANEAVVAGSSTGSSLMAMLLPALLQSARSGISPSDELLKDDKMDIGLRKTDGIDVESSKKQIDQQYVKELDTAPAAPAELGQPASYPNTNKSIGPMIINVASAEEEVDQQSVNLQELDKNAPELTEPQHPTSALNAKPVDINDLLPYRLESALEQLISRVSRVEDICLRFEEKMLKPIESMESRILNLELQLQNLTRSSLCCELPRCTRISSPAFFCRESNSNSCYNEGSDSPPGVASDSEKKVFMCDDTSNLFPSANFRPSLVVSAPEFSCGEDEEENDDTPCIKPKETLSIDDALAAALSGFISATKINPSDHIQTISGSSSLVDEKIQHCNNDESCQKKGQEFSSAENYGRESSQFTQNHSILVPDCILVENGDDEHLNYINSSLETASVYKNKEDHDVGMIPSSIQSKHSSASTSSCDFCENKNMGDLGLTWSGSFPVVSTCLNRTCIVNLDSSDTVEIYESNTVDSSWERGVSCDHTEAGDLVETGNYQIHEETIPRETNTDGLDDDQETKWLLEPDSGCKSVVPERYVAVERSFNDDSPNNFESSCASAVDYEFPILDVEFAFDDLTSTTRLPLEALLDGVAELNTEAHSIHDRADDDGNAEQIIVEIIDGNQTADLLPSSSLLVDLVVSSEDTASNSEGLDTLSASNSEGSLSSPINQEMIMERDGYHMGDHVQPKPVRMNNASINQLNAPGSPPGSSASEMQQFSGAFGQPLNDISKPTSDSVNSSVNSMRNVQGPRMLPPGNAQAMQISQGLMPGVSLPSIPQQPEQPPPLQQQPQPQQHSLMQQQHPQFQRSPMMLPANSMQHLNNIAQNANMQIGAPMANKPSSVQLLRLLLQRQQQEHQQSQMQRKMMNDLGNVGISNIANDMVGLGGLGNSGMGIGGVRGGGGTGISTPMGPISNVGSMNQSTMNLSQASSISNATHSGTLTPAQAAILKMKIAHDRSNMVGSPQSSVGGIPGARQIHPGSASLSMLGPALNRANINQMQHTAMGAMSPPKLMPGMNLYMNQLQQLQLQQQQQQQQIQLQLRQQQQQQLQQQQQQMQLQQQQQLQQQIQLQQRQQQQQQLQQQQQQMQLQQQQLLQQRQLQLQQETTSPLRAVVLPPPVGFPSSMGIPHQMSQPQQQQPQQQQTSPQQISQRTPMSPQLSSGAILPMSTGNPEACPASPQVSSQALGSVDSITNSPMELQGVNKSNSVNNA